MTLEDVYRSTVAQDVLYGLLRQRDASVNISHKSMPSWDDHIRFVESRPYEAWYLIVVDGRCIGATYLTRDDEIGISVFREHQGKGHGPIAVREIMELHPREHYLAHINPENERSIGMFEKLGFGHVQNTYEVRS